jgi:hypothetical protein
VQTDLLNTSEPDVVNYYVQQNEKDTDPNQNGNWLPMSGQSDQAVDIVATQETVVPVNVKRLVSRFQVTSIKAQYDASVPATDGSGDPASSDAKFQLKGIFMYNTYAYSNVDPVTPDASQMANRDMVCGLDSMAQAGWLYGDPQHAYLIHESTFPWLANTWDGLQAANNAELMMGLSDNGVSLTKKDSVYFYGFANQDVINRTAVIIYGHFQDPSAQSDWLYKNGVSYSEAQTGYDGYYAAVINKIALKNQVYNITAVLKGAANKLPIKVPPTTLGDLQVSVTVAPWDLVVDIPETFE